MKIIYISSFYSPYIGGGAEITLQTLVEAMAKYHEVSVITLSPVQGIHYDMINGIRVIRIGFKNIYWHFANSQPTYKKIFWHMIDIYNPMISNLLEKLLIEEQPDIVSLHNLAGFSSSVWSVLHKLSIPHVQVLHDFYSICPKSSMFKNGNSCTKQCIDCKLFRIAHSEISKNVNAVIGISQFVLDKHLEYNLFKNAQIKQVIYNARKYSIKSQEKPLVNSNKIIFGFIGSISKHKGIEFLLECFQVIHNDNVELKIAGKGTKQYEEFLFNRYSKDERIEFLGYVNPHEFYPAIDILIVPSLWNEPLGMIIPEAFSYGIPVIASNSGGIPEMVNIHHNGLIFDRENSTSLVEQIKFVIDNPESILKMSKNALNSAQLFCNIDNWIDEYNTVYQAIARENNVT